MTKCNLCSTQKSDSYGSVYGIGMVCHRCSLLSMGGPQMAMMPHCPPVPDDADPDVIAIQQLAVLEPELQPDEYSAWVDQQGNPFPSAKARTKDMCIGHKIQEWFSNQGGSVATELRDEPVDYDFLEGCAQVTAPTKRPVQSDAKAFITLVQVMIFLAPHHPDLFLGGQQRQQGSGCGWCGTDPCSSKCSRCKKMNYCSRECQKSHWKAHKKECMPTTN